MPKRTYDYTDPAVVLRLARSVSNGAKKPHGRTPATPPPFKRTRAAAWATDGVKPSAGQRRDSDLSHQAHAGTGQESPRRLNPQFVEWLMGWPIGWTGCGVLEMESFQSWRRKHSYVLRRVLREEVER